MNTATKKINILLWSFILLAASHTSAHAVPKNNNEVGLSLHQINATFTGVTEPYTAWQYKQNSTAYGQGLYLAETRSFGTYGELGIYLQISSASHKRFSSVHYEIGAEIRRHFGNGYCGIILNLPLSRTLWDWNWPTENSTPQVGESPMAPGLVLGYQISGQWSLRFSSIFNQEYVEYRANGDLTTQVAQIKSTRSFLTLVYHYGRKDGTAAAAE